MKRVPTIWDYFEVFLATVRSNRLQITNSVCTIILDPPLAREYSQKILIKSFLAQEYEKSAHKSSKKIVQSLYEIVR